jgi:hypothetical protein
MLRKRRTNPAADIGFHRVLCLPRTTSQYEIRIRAAFAAAAKRGLIRKANTPKVECCYGVLAAMLERTSSRSANRWFLGEITLARGENSIQHGLILARPLLLDQQRISGER